MQTKTTPAVGVFLERFASRNLPRKLQGTDGSSIFLANDDSPENSLFDEMAFVPEANRGKVLNVRA